MSNAPFSPNGPDPNVDRNDPMVPEFWQLGEDLQDGVRNAGFEMTTVEGIAVDVHDLLQAAEVLKTELIPAAIQASGTDLPERLVVLEAELEHIRWHCEAAIRYLQAAQAAIIARL